MEDGIIYSKEDIKNYQRIQFKSGSIKDRREYISKLRNYRAVVIGAEFAWHRNEKEQVFKVYTDVVCDKEENGSIVSVINQDLCGFFFICSNGSNKVSKEASDENDICRV